MKKRVSAMLLVAALCVSLMPTNVLAAEETTSEDAGGGISVLSVDSEIDETEESADETKQEVTLPEDTVEVTSEEAAAPGDDAGEETKALTGEGSFLYEDSDLTLKVNVSGNVDVPNAEEEISWDDVTMKASALGKDSDTYNQMESYAEESSGDLGSLIAMTLSFLYDGSELDVSDCDVDVTVKPSQDLINDAMPEPSDDGEGSSSVSASIVEADGDQVKELDSVTIGEDDDKDDVELNGELSEDEFGVMVLSTDDPVFTVQFYANLDVIDREHVEGDVDLSVIETHTDNGGAVLPQNGTTPQTSVIELKQTSAGDYVMDSEEVLTQMYVDETYEFVDEPDLHHMNKLEVNSDYALVEIWKLKDPQGDPESTDKNDWEVYEVSRIGDTEEYTKEFTNDPTAAANDPDLILVEDNDIFRFVYNTTSNTANLDTNFYDYNITDGNVYSSASTSSTPWTSGTKYVYTEEAGINVSGNYSGTGAKYAFGNQNTGTGLGEVLWNGNRLNASNSSNYGNGYQGCTFSLVKSLADGTVSFNDGIIAPNVFYGEAAGKETFTGQLFFNREGDTYTLSSAELSDGTSAGSGFETFTGRTGYEGSSSSWSNTIYSNDFWPMDNVSYEGMDPQFGNYEDYQAGSILRFNSSGTTGALPPSDDSTDHNSYFGMNFEIEFSYTSDYVGPLEYFFFGDDDMWVFLDDQLILDIGGVHSSVGEHVDLWDYLSQDAQPTADGDPTTYTHTLSVFYTERGASGSTCYIQYTLPEVSSITTVEDASNLLIEKEVQGADTDQEFEFTLTLEDENGDTLQNQYSYIVLNEAGNFEYSDTIKSGGTFKLKNGWRALIRNLPNGTVATATETRVPGYSTTYEVGATSAGTVSNTGSGTTASGTVIADDTTYIKFVNASDTPVKDVDVDGDGEYGDSGIQANVGDTLEYKIDYVNNTGETVKVTITDVLDKGLDYVDGSASDGGTYDESTRTITWVLEDVEADAPISVTFKATINENALETDEVKNTAKVQVNGDPEVETEPVYTPVTHKDVDADGDGEYGDSGDEVKVGDTLTYKIDYQNSYDEPATVTITDVLDQGLDYVEGSASDGGTYDAETRTITWVIEDVAPHSEVGYYVTFKATVNKFALTENEITNDATVAVNEDSQKTNEVDNPVPDKDVDADGDGNYGDTGVEVKVGDTLTYIIHYDNGYDRPAEVTITDTLDEGLTYVEGSASDGGTYDEATRTITWTFTSVEGHGNGSVTFQATVNDNALMQGEVDNEATVQIGEKSEVTNKVHNPVPHKDVDIHGDGTYGDSGEQVHVGDTLTYKIDYFNGYEIGDEGYEDPVTVTITDTLDVGLDFVSADNNGTYDDETRTITWVIENVPAQESGSVTFQATVNKDALEKNEVDNTATVTVGETSQVTNTVYNPVPEKDEDASGDGNYGDSGKGVHVGTRITFTIKYHNSDDTSATVKITDVLDVGLTYIEGSASDNGTYDEDTHTLTWEIPNVAAHSSGFVTFTAEVNENALTKHEVENTASVQIGNHAEKETNPVYNPVPEKDVDIHGDGTYGDSGLQVHVGDTLTYIVYYDNAYDEASTITITDTLDEGLDFVTADNGGTYDRDSRTITWTIPDVAGHTSGSVTFQATVNETAYVKNEVDNTAYVQIGDHDPDQTNTVYNPVPKKSVDADEDGTYEDSGDEVNVGDMLMYKIDYFNGYDDPSTITITDKLDEGVDFDSASDNGSYDPDTRTVTWVLKDVEPHTGGFVTLAVIVNKTALKENEVTNTAEIQIGNEYEVTNTVDNTVPDKDVDADGDGNYGDSGVEVKVGDTLEYIIYYDNGYDEAAEVIITDVLDESLDYIEGSASDGGTYDPDTRTITWELGEVAAHTDGSVTFKVTVNENAWVKGEVENTGYVQVGPHDPKVTNTVYNPTPHKDVDIDPDDGLDYGDSGLQVKVGDTLTYKIEYFNGEEDEPADVTITDVLDKGLDYVSADNGGTYDEATRTITWVIKDVPAQTGGNVTFTATVNEDALEKNEVENTANVTVDHHPEVETNTVYNPVPGKGVDTDENQEYDDNGEEVQVGDTLEYKIDYMNSNDVSATVTITDELDKGLDFVEASDGGDYNESNRTITWVIEDVEAHTGGSVTFKATVNRNALEVNEVKNTATVKVDNDAVVTNEVDNPVPDKGVDTDGDGEYDDDGEYVKIGDTLTYIITYDNADSDPVTVTITDTLDQGLDFVEASDGGTYDDSTRTITWEIKDVPAHTAGSVTFKATVNENVTEKYEVDNTAYVKVGTHEAVETNKVENPYRQYFPIDEEIVPDEDDRSTWVKEESVNEYNAIELEMTTQLPIIEPEALADGEFMMYFHNKLDHELVLDETTTDFKVYIGGTEISTDYYKITFDDETGDDCNFHVDVDLTALYNDGIVSADMLDGNTDITIYFFADLEGTDLNGSYTSTVWYDVYDGEDWEYTSNEDVVTVYTYEIKIQKVDENGDPLAGAEFGIYYDKECQEPVYRTYGSVFGDNQRSPYVVTSDADGVAMFYGLAEGTYYVKELSAPIGYVVSNEVIEIELNADTTDEDHVYSTTFENTPSNPDEPQDPVKGVDTDGDGDFTDNHLLVKVGDELTYRIWYYNYNDEAVTVTVTDTLDEALDFVSATDGGVYDESNRTITWTIENAPAKTVGYVDFKATVNDQALEKGKVENTGRVKIGNDDFVDTNTVENPVETESKGGGNPNPGGGNPKSGTGTPKTSDTNNIALWLALLIAAMAAVIVALRMRKRS